MAVSQVDGVPVFDIFDDHAGAPIDLASAAGNGAGGFATPEAQYLARSRSEAVKARPNGPGL